MTFERKKNTCAKYLEIMYISDVSILQNNSSVFFLDVATVTGSHCFFSNKDGTTHTTKKKPRNLIFRKKKRGKILRKFHLIKNEKVLSLLLNWQLYHLDPHKYILNKQQKAYTKKKNENNKNIILLPFFSLARKIAEASTERADFTGYESSKRIDYHLRRLPPRKITLEGSYR